MEKKAETDHRRQHWSRPGGRWNRSSSDVVVPSRGQP